jgi:hypothetical protein
VESTFPDCAGESVGNGIPGGFELKMRRQKAKGKGQKAKVSIRKATPHSLAYRPSAFIENLRSNPNFLLPFDFSLPWI